MRYLPLHFDLKGRPVLVVGGGELARRKIDLLVNAGADVAVVAPEVSEKIRELVKDTAIMESKFDAALVSTQALIVAATSDADVNRLVSETAQANNIPVNVVDNPDLCTVTFPAVIDRDPMVISVGSGGSAPVLVRRIREQVETMVPERIKVLASFLQSRRSRLKARFTDVEERRRHTEVFLDGPGAELAAAGKHDEADSFLFLEDQEIRRGEVYLVGAGPGDPDLLTLRALQLMQKASVVLYDNLVSPRVLDRVRRDATMEFVGKRSGYKSTSQEDINDLLVRLAGEGERVLRLKGGDPFIFGRGGEEIISLIQHEIPFQVVPGITAATGCAAYAGIPLTHRDISQSVRFVTGHPKDGEVNLPWEDFTRSNETVVFYMGLAGLSSICQQLIQHGRSASTPVAIVSKGTTPEQRILKGTLETITGLVARVQIETPTLIIVGDVINFAER